MLHIYMREENDTNFGHTTNIRYAPDISCAYRPGHKATIKQLTVLSFQILTYLQIYFQTISGNIAAYVKMASLNFHNITSRSHIIVSFIQLRYMYSTATMAIRADCLIKNWQRCMMDAYR
jgi:hypothetical protein